MATSFYAGAISGTIDGSAITSGLVGVTYGGTGLDASGATNGQLLIGKTTGSFALATLTAGSGVTITNGSGTITIAATGSGGTVTSITAGTGLTGGTITGSGTIALSTPVTTANGGTGLDTSAAANGSLLIGNGSGLTLANLTAGTGISITNGSGTISIAATGGGTVTSITAGTGLTGGTITTSGTIALSTPVSVTNGGTGSNLSATGGTSQVLKQTSSGAAITVAQLAASDLSDGTTGSGSVVLATSPTLVTPVLGAASGTLLVLSSLTLTDQTSAITTAATYNGTVPTGIFKKSWVNSDITALGAVASGTLTLCIAPAKTVIRGAYIVVDTAATFAAGNLTMSLGDGSASANYTEFVVASNIKAAANTVYGDTSGERGPNMTGWVLAGGTATSPAPGYTSTTTLKVNVVASAGTLSSVTTSTGTIYIWYEILP